MFKKSYMLILFIYGIFYVNIENRSAKQLSVGAVTCQTKDLSLIVIVTSYMTLEFFNKKIFL